MFFRRRLIIRGKGLLRHCQQWSTFHNGSSLTHVWKYPGLQKRVGMSPYRAPPMNRSKHQRLQHDPKQSNPRKVVDSHYPITLVTACKSRSASSLDQSGCIHRHHFLNVCGAGSSPWWLRLRWNIIRPGWFQPLQKKIANLEQVNDNTLDLHQGVLPKL